MYLSGGENKDCRGVVLTTLPSTHLKKCQIYTEPYKGTKPTNFNIIKRFYIKTKNIMHVINKTTCQWRRATTGTEGSELAGEQKGAQRKLRAPLTRSTSGNKTWTTSINFNNFLCCDKPTHFLCGARFLCRCAHNPPNSEYDVQKTTLSCIPLGSRSSRTACIFN